MSDLSPLIHEKVNIVLTIENGKVIHVRPVQNGEVTASLETFLWMAERAGLHDHPTCRREGQWP
ncbi:hypothetical protein ACOJ98_002414 [Escherichia coli]|nr:hypothetical protein [Escherichia coli]